MAGFFCPNRNDSEFQRLLREHGEDLANYYWQVRYGKEIERSKQDDRAAKASKSKKFEVLNDKGRLELKLGLRWNEYSPDKKGPKYPHKIYKDKDKAYNLVKSLNKDKLYESPYKAVIKDANREGGQGGFYTVELAQKKQYRQLTKDPEKANEELDALLKKRMGELGIRVEAYEELKDRSGRDVAGIADLFENVIQVSKGSQDAMTLPEETSHFLIEMMKDNKMVERMKSLVRETDLYDQTFEEYKDNIDYQYEDGTPNEDKIAKEAAGKLLADKIINRYQEPKLEEKTQSLLKRIWNRFLSLFGKAKEGSFKSEVDKVFGGTAEKIIGGNLEGFDPNVLKKGRFYRQGKDQTTDGSNKKMDRYEESLTKTLQALDKKIKVNRTKKAATDRFLKQKQTLQKDLLKEYREQNYLRGNIRFLQQLRKETAKITGETNRRNEEEAKGKFREIEEELESDDVNVSFIAKRLRDIRDYVGTYSDIVETMKKEVRMDPDLYKDYKNAILNELQTQSSRISDIEKEYQDMSQQVFKDFLKKFSTNPESEIDNLFSEPWEDIGYLDRYLNSLAETNNDALRVIDKIVKDKKHDMRQLTLERKNELERLRQEAEESGIEDLSFMYERDANGELTGFLLEEVNWHEFEKAKENFFQNLNDKYNLPQDKAENKRIRDGDLRAVANWYDGNKSDPQFAEWANKRVGAPNRKEFLIALSEAVRKDYGKEAAKWFQEHQEPNPQAEQLIEKKKKELSEVDFNDWLAENIIEEFDGSKKYIRDLAKPKKEKYKNKQYEALTENQEKYLERIKDIMEEENKKLGSTFRMGDRETRFLAPQMRKDIVERAKTKGSKRALEEIKEGFQRKEDEMDFGSMYNLTDERGREIKMIPRQFTKELSDKRDLSTDIISSMALFSSMTNNYKKMNEIVDVLELGRDAIEGHEFKKTKGGKEVKQRLTGSEETSFETVSGAESRVYQRLQDYMNMMVYGEMKADEGTIGNSSIDKAKTIDTFGSYVAINNLALNAYAGFANIGFGNAMINVEAAAKEYFSMKALRTASNKYYANLPNNLSQIGNRYRTDKLSAWSEKMDTLQDFQGNLFAMDSNRKTWLGHMFKISSLFFMNHAGEHYMQTRASLALAEEAQVRDKDGNVKSLFDASYMEGNELKIEEGIVKHVPEDGSRMWNKNEDGQSFSNKDLKRFINKQHFINKRLHGIYNDIDKSAIQQYSLGRLAMMFRKFIVPGVNRRFKKLQYNEEGETWTEGYHRTTVRFMGNLIKDLRQGQFSLQSNWKQLSKMEKANFMRSLTDVAYVAGTAILASFLTNMSDDDDDNWTLNMAAYQANRIHTELAFYYPFAAPDEFFRIMKSPAAGVDQAEKLIQLLDLSSYFEGELERGPYEGWNRGGRNLFEAVPLAETVGKELHNPYDKLAYFSRE